MIALCTVLSGGQTAVDMAIFGREKEPFLRDFLKLEHGPPSHDTFSRVFRLLDPEQFGACFQRFLARFAENCQGVIAIDGKVVRRSFDKASGRSALHMVSAWGCDQRFPGEWRFKDLAMIAMVEAEVERGEKVCRERTLLPLLGQALRQAVRPGRARPLARREPPPLGHGRRLPRRSHAPQDQQWPRQHGRHPPYEPQPHPQHQRQRKPQGQTKNARLGRCLPPRRSHYTPHMRFKPFPWRLSVARALHCASNANTPVVRCPTGHPRRVASPSVFRLRANRHGWRGGGMILTHRSKNLRRSVRPVPCHLRRAG